MFCGGGVWLYMLIVVDDDGLDVLLWMVMRMCGDGEVLVVVCIAMYVWMELFVDDGVLLML